MILVACSALALISLRAMKGVNRIENKTGIVIDLKKAFDARPFPVPTTAGGFALVVAFAILGVALALTGKWAERF